ncbi:hypothetical protein KAFR_0G03060 [Kazachstania africana CBS 2517]|uniref:Arrestin C-terminal-like domain-containing protein n=1 Tax=Kazachstania africana (strain ATCC 22294 / BCRC 22015 / CBS 2517 / CECT 1963 / NBRC 1671 / NRRL Y-8276) TaxID=1071382 RepID=H2AY88_KAZAF|nr:hypothetical protein KAFR_0G03060 [Kazachstania africana CBS 2517]CCF59338.1 hypothetical protein KAFR_0G03060 [Kazachstania africana CBS 2517]
MLSTLVAIPSAPRLTSKIVGSSIILDVPYEDLILIQESFDNDSIPISGKIKLELKSKLNVYRVKLRLIGAFKLDFLQISKNQSKNSLVSIVKERKNFLECYWDNLLVDSNGDVIVHNFKKVGSKNKNKRWNKKKIPFLRKNGSNNFNIGPGELELPFNIELPGDIPETVEGLQSVSILYNFELIVEDDSINDESRQIYSDYRYLRILKTISGDNMAIHEEMSMGKTIPGKLQYELKIPSRALAIGSKIPLSIKIFPFEKRNFQMNKISVTMMQEYWMKDLSDEIYFDKTIVFKQSMNDFGNLVEQGSNRLIDIFQLNSELEIPDNLKRITQDCQLPNSLLEVRHKLIFQISLFDHSSNKGIEIKANIPVLVYISPTVEMKGRLVLFDRNTGKIHFRTGELVPLFVSDRSRHDGDNASVIVGTADTCPVGHFMPQHQLPPLPPPNYEERVRDRLMVIAHNNSNSSNDFDESTDRTNDYDELARQEVPTYEETMLRPVE